MNVSHRAGRRLRVAAYATVFLSNSAIMTLELVAGRVVSPHLGMSLYTWTSIIGVVMAGMSLGNYAGGRLSDRFRARATLALLFLLSAAGCASVLYTNHLIGNLAALRALSWPLRIFAHTGAIFFVPALLLGAISPVVARMALGGGGDAGRVMGGVFAWGVAGSILGTFATGFYLVAAFPVPVIVGGSAGVLAVVGAGYAVSNVLRREPAPSPLVQMQHASEPRRKWTLREWFPPNATVFASNAGFIVIEVAALRIIAREFGASLYAWTSVIGVVLAGVTCGNYLGGRLAARRYGAPTVWLLFALAAVSAFAALWLNTLVSALRTESTALMTLPWPVQITLHTAAAFLLPNLFIGMISPVVVKRALAQGHAAGHTVGNIYAWGAVGSIVATFVSGYALVDWFGPHALVVLVGALLAFTGLCYRPRSAPSWTVMALAAAALALVYVPVLGRAGAALGFHPPRGPHVVYQDESQYSYIAVEEHPDNPRVREMILDKLTHSEVNLDDPTDLRYEYEEIYAAVINRFYPPPEPLKALVIGGGGYAFPRYLEVTRPGSHIEVAEIDPAVTEAAFAAFGLPRHTTIRIYNQDARNRVADLMRAYRAKEDLARFDCIFGDSINDYTVPYHLTTLEFAEQIHTLLSPEGMYLLNLIDMYNSGRFAGAVLNTLGQVFGDIHVFNTGRAPTVRDTFVIVCSKTPRDLSGLPIHLPKLPETAINTLLERSRGIVLTDRYAPVENLLAPVVRTQGGKLGEMRLDIARERAAQGDIEAALEQARAALDMHPVWPEGWAFLAELLKKQGNRDGAINALENAIKGHQEPAKAHDDAAQALFEAQRYQDALRHWQAAATFEPRNGTHKYNQGMAYAALDQLDKAVAAWRAAAGLNPRDFDALHNLALGYLFTGQPEKAWETVDRIRAGGGTPRPELLANLNARAPRPQ